MRHFRRKHNNADGFNICKTPETLYVKNKAANWLLRLSECGVLFSQEFFSCLEWSRGTLLPVARSILDSIGNMTFDDTTEAVDIFRDYVEKGIGAPFGNLRKLSERCPSLDTVVRKIIKSATENEKKIKPGLTSFSQARRRIRRYFDLGEAALDLHELIYIKELFYPVSQLLDEKLEIFSAANRKLLAVILEKDLHSIEQGLSELVSCGFITLGITGITVFYELFDFWDISFNEKTSDFFCRQLAGKTLPLESFTIPEADMSHVISLLRSERNEPLHILFYGPPGTGKSSCAASLAKSLGLKAWAVPPSKPWQKNEPRKAALTACLNMTARRKGSFLLMDEADRFLDTNDTFGRDRADKAWINDIMERPGVRMIWIANDVRHLDDSVKRRFTYSVSFESLGAVERRNIWTNILRNRRVKNRLPDEMIDKFARGYEIPPSVVESAVCQAKAARGGKRNFAETAERVVRSYVTLVKNGGRIKDEAADFEKFSIAGSCIDGAIDEFINMCQAADAKKRECGGFPPGGATMLFYGPPGTGKSALARYLSYTLGRKLIVKKASDLLGPYVGQTEQLIADAFRQTEREEGILLIDEADSFLHSRGGAAKSWENTMVNEFLTSLEECREFCVCTTNRMDDLDPAALRRFSFKIPFTYAKPDQAEKLYAAILAELVEAPVSDTDIEKLSRLPYLTPGDFRAVKNRNWLAPSGSLSHAKLVAELEAEQNAKLERTAKQVGFAIV
jgi:SpoVK/Ycf46/Vps4 family AAA+-type ATPase